MNRNPNQQRGAALIVAMLIFALCTALIVAMKVEFDLYYQRGANAGISEQIYGYLRGAEELGTLALLQDYDEGAEQEPPRDDFSEFWATPAQRFLLDEGGWWEGELRDLQGLLNLNALAAPPVKSEGEQVRWTTAQQQFIRLLNALEDLQVSEQDAFLITDSIADWLDEDGEARPYGAEDDYYSAQTPVYRTANRLMQSVSELRLVAYVTPEIYEALIPWVAVLPDVESHLNILTAPPMILRTINVNNKLFALSEEDGKQLALHRCGEGGESVEAFLQHSVFGNTPEIGLEGNLKLNSEYFVLHATAKVADRTLQMYSVLERKGRSVAVVSRSSEYPGGLNNEVSTCAQ